jgi:hypothetical protein
MWCDDTKSPVPAEILDSASMNEPSILYSMRGKEKLIPVKISQLGTHVTVNHFYCMPLNDMAL